MEFASILKRALPAAALSVMMAGGAQAAPTLDFVVDGGNSSVTLTDYSGGIVCALSSCGIDVDLAAGLDGTSFSLGTGDAFSFDFLTFTADGTTALNDRNFNITATLAFSEPDGANTTGNGSGGAFLLEGYILAGYLYWTNLPTDILLPNGSTINVAFDEGIDLFAGFSPTIEATVSGVDIVDVPEPATLALLGAGLLGLGAISRRRSQAAA